MRVKETVIRPIGNSAGVTIPKDMRERYGLERGARVFVRETDEGLLITPYDPDFERAMGVYRQGARRFRNAMRELSKR